jgi:predicted Na+-dependent transporter
MKRPLALIALFFLPLEVSSAAALGAAVFGPWSAITSSALASWWRRRPINHEIQTTQPK